MLASPAPCTALAAGGMGWDGMDGEVQVTAARQNRAHTLWWRCWEVDVPGMGGGDGSEKGPWCWDGAMVPAWSWWAGSWCGGLAGLVPAAGAGAGAAAAARAQPPPRYPGTGPQELGRGAQTPPECRWRLCPHGAGGARSLGAARVAPWARGAWRPWEPRMVPWGWGLCLSSSLFKPFPFASARCFLLLSSKSLSLPWAPSLQHRHPAQTPACAHLRATSPAGPQPTAGWVEGCAAPCHATPPSKAAGISAAAAPHRPQAGQWGPRQGGCTSQTPSWLLKDTGAAAGRGAGAGSMAGAALPFLGDSFSPVRL